jgi:stress-induced morphogen
MVQVRGPSDSGLMAIGAALDEYLAHHPSAQVVVYRRDSVSIRIRIVDPDFAHLNRVQRHHAIMPSLRKLPEELRSDITVLLLLTPDEADGSFANMEFENPVPAPM